MNFNDNTFVSSARSQATIDQGLREYMLKVYNYMTLGLALTGVTAFFTSSSPELMGTLFQSPLAWLVMLAPLGFVLVLSFGIHRMAASTAQMVFWAFAVVMGLSMSMVFLVYTNTSIAKVFFITSGTFAAMSLYGYTTKKDLTSIGTFLLMGLIGIVIAGIVNIFLASSALSFAVSVLGVVIFTGLTAYDTQKIKQMFYHVSSDGELYQKSAIMGALSLYLDFINLFYMLLRLLGDRR